MSKKSDRSVRPNETIGLVPKAGQTIVLNQRLLYASLLFISRQQGDIPQYQAFLTDIAGIVGIDIKRNNKYFRGLLDGLRELSFQVAVEIEEDGQKVQDDLTIGYIDRPGFRSRTGVGTRVLWSLDPEIKKRLLNPIGNYTLIPLGVIAKLETGPAVALAEICYQYRTNYAGGKVGTTGRRSLAEWYPILLGHHVEAGYQYKYFKRDILERIKANVSAECPFSVDYIEYKVGRKVQQLEFLIIKKPNEKKESPELLNENLVDEDLDESDYLIRRITKEIGTTKKDAALILTKYKDRSYVEKHINEQLKQQAGGFKPDSSVAVFKARLKNNYSDAPIPQASINTHASQRLVDSVPTVQEPEDDGLINALAQMEEGERSDILEDFLAEQTEFVRERFHKTHLENRIVRAHLRDWLKKNGLVSALGTVVQLSTAATFNISG